MWLVCSGRCGGKLFRALSATVEVDESGNYESHQILQPGYACLACGSPAMDLAQVPVEMAVEEDADEPPVLLDILCPVCETAVSVGPESECPNCGSELEVS